MFPLEFHMQEFIVKEITHQEKHMALDKLHLLMMLPIKSFFFKK